MVHVLTARCRGARGGKKIVQGCSFPFPPFPPFWTSLPPFSPFFPPARRRLSPSLCARRRSIFSLVNVELEQEGRRERGGVMPATAMWNWNWNKLSVIPVPLPHCSGQAQYVEMEQRWAMGASTRMWNIVELEHSSVSILLFHIFPVPHVPWNIHLYPSTGSLLPTDIWWKHS